MKSLSTLFVLSFALTAVVIVGCSDDSTGPVTSGPPNTMGSQDNHSGHAHPTEGPHHGDLIELGNEEYHAELIHPEHHDDDGHSAADGEGQEEEDDAGITIYVLDSSATKMVAIDAKEVTVNLTMDGQPAQFKLGAMPTEDDPEGKSSRFASNDHDLLEHFHEVEHVEGTLVLAIAGKSYRGKISHEHDHAEHPHGDDEAGEGQSN